MKILIALLVVPLLASVSAVHADGRAPTTADPSRANYHGTIIDLGDDWGTAKACTTDGVETVCFDNEVAMDEFLATTSRLSTAVSQFTIQSACVSSLRLYTGTSFTGSVLNLTSQGIFINLSVYSFNNVTSSYKVGACRSTFYDGANGGSPVYPGNTNVFAEAASMVGGWDNRVSSVYIS